MSSSRYRTSSRNTRSSTARRRSPRRPSRTASKARSTGPSTTARGASSRSGPPAMGAPDLAINVHRIGDKQAAIHVIRYDYDEERDEVPALDSMHLDVRLGRPFRMVKVFSPRGDVKAKLTYSRDVREMHRLELENV